MRFGYFLSAEEYTPAELVEQAKAAADNAAHRCIVRPPPGSGSAGCSRARTRSSTCASVMP